MVENVISGHTGTLTDGDYILSPSLTNIFEGIHGNGILMYEDTAVGDSNRNAKVTSPGYVSDNGTNSIVLRGGYAVLDGLIIPFGNIAAGATQTITLQESTIQGGGTALTNDKSCLLVVYACSDTDNNGIHIEQGNNVDSGFPVTPEGFLSDTSGLTGTNLASKQSTALAVVKCVYNSGAGDLNMEVTAVYDVRTFVKPSPIYFSPMTTGSLGNQTGRIDSTADLDGMHGGGDEVGGLSSSNFGGMWMSYSYGTNGTDGDHVLYFSGKQGGSRTTHRIGPNKISVLNISQNVRFDGPNIFNATPASGDITITPTGTFPPSHMIIVNNAQTSTHKVIFDPSGLSNGAATVGDVGTSSSAIFVYNDSVWVKVFATSSAVGASGSSGAIQISDGSAFSNDSDLTFTGGNTLNTVHLTMAGLLTDASGIAFKASVSSNPAGSGPDARTLWYDDGNDVLKFGSSTVQLTDTAGLMDINGLSAAVLASGDFISFSDTTASNVTKKESIDDVATLFAGTGLTASSAVIGIDASQPTITAIGPSNAALTVGQNLIVTGDLTVNGTNTVINSTTLQVDDKLIELAHSPSGSEGDDAAVDGAGIIVKSSDSDKSILWMDDTDGWEFNQHVFPASDSALNIGSDTIRFATGYLDTLVSTNLTIDTNLLKTDSANNRVGINQAAPDAPFQVEELGFGYGTGTRTWSGVVGHSSGATAVTINLFKRTEFKAAKLLVSVENTTDSVYETAEMVLTHSGTTTAGTNIVADNVFLSVYGIVTSSTTKQGAYQGVVTGAGTSQYIQLQVTPTVADKSVTVRVSWQALTI